mgnify:CR=1 FL=1
MRTLEMWLRNIFKRKDYIFSVLFGLYIGAVLWLTLFSRIGSHTRSFLWPLHSYVRIIKGDGQFLIENVANVCLFIPFGFVLSRFERNSVKRVALIGFYCSLFIEILQSIFALGIFECDDLAHNTLGTILGFYIFKKYCGKLEIKLNGKMKSFILCSVLLFFMIPLGVRGVRCLKMIKLATLHDAMDGKKNLLVLDGQNSCQWGADVYVKYHNDGSISIKGEAKERTWERIAEIELNSGVYEFFDLIPLTDGKIKTYIAPYNKEKEDYILQLVQSNESLEFELKEKTKVRVYISIEVGCKENTQLVPVIYKIS